MIFLTSYHLHAHIYVSTYLSSSLFEFTVNELYHIMHLTLQLAFQLIIFLASFCIGTQRLF